MQISITVCNVCQAVDRQTTTYKVESWNDSRRVTLDLCSEHASPLEAFLSTDSPTTDGVTSTTEAPKKRASRSGRRTGGGIAVTPIGKDGKPVGATPATA